jgi:hypothetical protein
MPSQVTPIARVAACGHDVWPAKATDTTAATIKRCSGVAPALRDAHHEIEHREATLERRARNEGIAWEQIAVTLGVSKQAVAGPPRNVP